MAQENIPGREVSKGKGPEAETETGGVVGAEEQERETRPGGRETEKRWGQEVEVPGVKDLVSP